MEKTFKEVLEKLGACREAREWAGDKDLKTFIETCERGDWLLWLAQKLNVDHRKLTLAKARCAATVLHLMKDERSKKAVEVAEKYGLGLATKEELTAAYADAYAAAAADAAYAAYAAAYAAYADAAAARKENRMKTANICREILTDEIINAFEY